MGKGETPQHRCVSENARAGGPAFSGGRSADFGEVTGANLNVLLTVSLRKMYTIWGRSFPAKGPAETPGGNGRKPGEQRDPFGFLGGRSGCCPERRQDTGLHE